MGFFDIYPRDKGRLGRPMSLREQAVRYVERGEYSKAISAYELLLSQERDRASIYNILGDLYEKMGNTKEAYEQYEHAIAEYDAEDQYRNAIGVAKKVLRSHKEQVEIYKRLADLYAREGRVGDAILALNRYAEKAKGSDSTKLVAEIKETIARIKNNSLLVQEEEPGVFLPTRYEEITPISPGPMDPEAEARKLEEERIVRDLEFEIKQEMLSNQQRIPGNLPDGAATVKEHSVDEDSSGTLKRTLELEEQAAALEKLVEETIQASEAPNLEPLWEEWTAQETISIESGEEPVTISLPEENLAPKSGATDGIREVSFLELDQLETARDINEGTVFAELIINPHDSERHKSRFDQEISRSDRYGRPLSLVMMQVEILKRTPGDKVQAGKERLSKVSLVRGLGDSIRAALRNTDFLAYNADGRIVLILPETEKEDALVVAQRLKGRIANLLSERKFQGEQKRVGLGVIGYPKDAQSKEELKRKAQYLMDLGEKEEYLGRILMLAN